MYDPSAEEPYGFLEVKCPYSQRDKMPIVACRNSKFCCAVQKKGELDMPTLKLNHPYYAQVQGQMAIGGRKWCDFTPRGISVECIYFDDIYCRTKLLPKLHDFWHKCVAPEVIQPVYHLGLPLRDMRVE